MEPQGETVWSLSLEKLKHVVNSLDFSLKYQRELKGKEQITEFIGFTPELRENEK